MSYQTEHPGFEFPEGVTVPEGWTDESWHNDACPSWTKYDLRLWIDYPAELSEFDGELPRFSLAIINLHGEHLDDLIGSDDWAVILKAIKDYENEAEKLSVRRFDFACDDDVIDFLNWCVDKGLTFHFDDGLTNEEFDWNAELTDREARIMENNRIALWAYTGDPWQFVEKYPEVWERYKEGEK